MPQQQMNEWMKYGMKHFRFLNIRRNVAIKMLLSSKTNCSAGVLTNIFISDTALEVPRK
jgi:hypothetical protein